MKIKVSTILLAFTSLLVNLHASSTLPAPMPDFMDKEQLATWNAKQDSATKAVVSTQETSSQFYTGKPYVADAGGYVYKYRTYNPELGRWTSADPSGFPDGVNNFSYAKNQVICSLDNNGLETLYSKPQSPTFNWVYGPMIPDQNSGVYYQYRAQLSITGWTNEGGGGITSPGQAATITGGVSISQTSTYDISVEVQAPAGPADVTFKYEASGASATTVNSGQSQNLPAPSNPSDYYVWNVEVANGSVDVQNCFFNLVNGQYVPVSNQNLGTWHGDFTAWSGVTTYAGLIVWLE
jgi:RHS repeat-associated protein